MTTEYTDHFRLNLPDFRSGPWHDLVNQDFEMIDELIMGLYQGVNTTPWANNTHFTPGQVAIDDTDNSFWVCVTEHTSAPTGTFAADRAAHPTYWTRVVVGVVPRGEWANSTHYFPNDVVSSSVSHVIAMCITEHTSNASGTIRDDAAYWSFIADMGGIVVDAAAVGYNNTHSGVTQTNLQDTTDDLYAKNTSQQTSINSNTSNITSLTSRMGAVESTNTTQDSNIAANSAAISGKLSDAPVDGNKYARLSGAWAIVTDFIDAPSDGNNYGRKNGAWTATLPDAPSDGSTYGRKNGAWAIASGSGGISDAPSDGTYYTRRNATWQAGTEEAPNDGQSYVRKSKAWSVAAAGGATVYIQDAAPSSPSAGNLWWQSSTGTLFIYYNDGNSSQWVAIATPPTQSATVIRSYLAGLTMSTTGSSTTMTIAAGQCADSSNIDMMTLSASMNKTSGAWAAGSGVGGLDTGVIANGTWYHFFVIKNPATGAVDVLISLSPTAPTLPSGFTLFRRIGSMLTQASGGLWWAFTQLGDEFLYTVPAGVASSVAFSVTAALLYFSAPTGIQVNAFGYIRADYATNAATFTLSPPDIPAPAVGGQTTTLVVSGTCTNMVNFFNLRTDTSGRLRWQANGTGPTWSAATLGWIDRRGRDL